MKRLALAITGAAVAGLATACTHTATPSAAHASQATSSATAASPSTTPSVSAADCRQQYDTWKQGPGKGLVAALTAVGSAGTQGNTQQLTTALKQAQPAVARAAKSPVPACADPKGYWEVVLMHVNAAASSTGSAASLQAAMKGVPQLTNQLVAELNRTGG